MPLTKLPPGSHKTVEQSHGSHKTDKQFHGLHKIKLHAHSVFFSVPKIKRRLFFALVGAPEAILISLPKMVPQYVLMINSALSHYSISKA